MYLIQLSNDQNQEVSGVFWDLTQSEFVQIVTQGMSMPSDMITKVGINEILTCTAVQDPTTQAWIKNTTASEAELLYPNCSQTPSVW